MPLAEGVELDLPQMLKVSLKVLSCSSNKNKVDYFEGTASFSSPNVISVEAKKVNIATGSEVTPLPNGII
jgi:pyruvate/2-oxoglutarate dehydrogenase complex dihydrolipoamide dehydrogenase (E3) component